MLKSWSVLRGALVMSSAVPGMAIAQTEAPRVAAASVVAQAVDAAPIATIVDAPVTPNRGFKLPVGKPVSFEFAAQLDSKTSKIDATFPIRLTDPIMLGDAVVVPAGTMGEGQVVHAAKAGWGGKAGELIVAARYIDFNGTRIPLRRFRMGELSVGEDRRGGAIAASVLVSPLLGFFIDGGEKTILIGTRANAIVSADTEIAAAPVVVPASAATMPSAAETPVQQEGDVK